EPPPDDLEPAVPIDDEAIADDAIEDAELVASPPAANGCWIQRSPGPSRGTGAATLLALFVATAARRWRPRRR
ncbi:MAG TPA: hypothetical protein VMG12_36735, partial [Polyangiaceae bacterium]|nr:hypothetical protein [Polyangiaceae bacterium]